jgi:ribosomal protein S11
MIRHKTHFTNLRDRRHNATATKNFLFSNAHNYVAAKNKKKPDVPKNITQKGTNITTKPFWKKYKPNTGPIAVVYSTRTLNNVILTATNSRFEPVLWVTPAVCGVVEGGKKKRKSRHTAEVIGKRLGTKILKRGFERVVVICRGPKKRCHSSTIRGLLIPTIQKTSPLPPSSRRPPQPTQERRKQANPTTNKKENFTIKEGNKPSNLGKIDEPPKTGPIPLKGTITKKQGPTPLRPTPPQPNKPKPIRRRNHTYRIGIELNTIVAIETRRPYNGCRPKKARKLRRQARPDRRISFIPRPWDLGQKLNRSFLKRTTKRFRPFQKRVWKSTNHRFPKAEHPRKHYWYVMNMPTDAQLKRWEYKIGQKLWRSIRTKRTS